LRASLIVLKVDPGQHDNDKHTKEATLTQLSYVVIWNDAATQQEAWSSPRVETLVTKEGYMPSK
jgi:hypothetical protein